MESSAEPRPAIRTRQTPPSLGKRLSKIPGNRIEKATDVNPVRKTMIKAIAHQHRSRRRHFKPRQNMNILISRIRRRSIARRTKPRHARRAKAIRQIIFYDLPARVPAPNRFDNRLGDCRELRKSFPKRERRLAIIFPVRRHQRRARMHDIVFGNCIFVQKTPAHLGNGIIRAGNFKKRAQEKRFAPRLRKFFQRQNFRLEGNGKTRRIKGEEALKKLPPMPRFKRNNFITSGKFHFFSNFAEEVSLKAHRRRRLSQSKA